MIRHEPFKAMMIAAGLGAAVAALVGLLARPHSNQRDH
jgi:gas vesicle protein